MTALAANKTDNRAEGKVVEFRVDAGKHIYEGALVNLEAPDTAAVAKPASDAAGEKFVGTALEEVDNTDGGDGDLKVRVRIDSHLVKVVSAGLNDDDVGVDMYISDDQTVAKVGVTTNDIYAGRVVIVESATSCWIKTPGFHA